MVYVPPPQYAFVEEAPVESHYSAPAEEETNASHPSTAYLTPHRSQSSAGNADSTGSLPAWITILIVVSLFSGVVIMGVYGSKE